jgi:hypothetical protein
MSNVCEDLKTHQSLTRWRSREKFVGLRRCWSVDGRTFGVAMDMVSCAGPLASIDNPVLEASAA